MSRSVKWVKVKYFMLWISILILNQNILFLILFVCFAFLFLFCFLLFCNGLHDICGFSLTGENIVGRVPPRMTLVLFPWQHEMPSGVLEVSESTNVYVSSRSTFIRSVNVIVDLVAWKRFSDSKVLLFFSFFSTSFTLSVGIFNGGQTIEKGRFLTQALVNKRKDRRNLTRCISHSITVEYVFWWPDDNDNRHVTWSHGQFST